MRVLKLFSIFIFLLYGNAIAQGNKITKSSQDTSFTSDNLEVNEQTNIMTATGNVIIVSDGRKITANEVTYDQDADKAIAIGNVVLFGKDGSKFESEEVILTNEFKSIIAIPLNGRLADDSYIAAKSLKRNDLGDSFFNEGIYTACNCNIKEGETPIWRLESNSIKHDLKTKTIYFKHVKMKIFSIPVYYLPYLSVPDWTVRRRTGFLTPVYGYSKQNRFHSKIPFYYAPENDESWDMTVTSHQNGKTGHADQLNFRKKLESTTIVSNVFKGNLNTNKSDGDNVFGMNLSVSSKLSNNWNMELVGKYSDQDTFMRRYGLDADSKYKSFINLEKLNKNSISNIEMYNIENLDEGKNSNNEPVLAPAISHHIFNSNNDYTYDIKINAHSIYNDEYYDIKRWSGSGEIGKIIDYNNYIFEANANLGLDLYSIQGRPSTDTDNNRYIERISSGLSMSVSKQHYINYDSFGLLLEPKIQYSTIISPDRTDEIPNRDSAEFRLDQANLFFNNQYQGRDNIQKNARINTGFTSLIMSEKFGNLDFFIGQSQKMSGTEKNITTKDQDRQSHIINSIDWSLSEAANFSWFSLYNHHNIKSDLSSFTFNGSKDDWSYSANHNSILNEFISDSSDREELKLSLSKNFAEWKTSYSTTYDMNDNKQNRISESLGIEYTGSGYMFQNCLTILLQYKNNGGVVDRDILPENSIYLTFNFRNLGDYTYMPNLPKI